ncbi:MAG: ribonuclease H-like domain-containing protein [Alphaproteobacteria bacterium]
MEIVLHQEDLHATFPKTDWVSIDTEAMGLNPFRDRLCLVQLYAGDTCHLVQFGPDSKYHAPKLKALLENPKITKIFHYARFDIMMIKKYLGVSVAPLYCTKLASKLARTSTDRHSLKDLCHSLLGIELSKQEQSSDWGRLDLTEAQKQYAATDVLHLHDLRQKLDEMLKRENRVKLAEGCFKALPTCIDLDLLGWEIGALFSHK